MPSSRLLTRGLLIAVAAIALVGIAAVLLADDAEAVASISLSTQGADTQSVDPGSSATFKINVTNLLTTTTLTVNITNSTPPTHWTAQLSQTKITVQALQTKSITLTVGVPANASADSVGKQVIVTADPDFGDTEQITTTTKVSQTYGIQTSSSVTAKSTVGGSAVTFSLMVNNTGNGQDTVALTSSGQPGTWTVSHVSSVTVPANSARTVTITVVPPSSANAGTYQTTLKATSGDGSTNDQTTFIVIIEPVYGLTLSSSDVSKYVTPNTPAYYNLSVTNTGNTGDNAGITIVNKPSGWTVLPTSNPVALAPNQTKGFQVLVTAPSTAQAGTQVQIAINASSQGNTSIVQQLSINAVVNQVYDPRVTPQSNSKLVKPGESVTFKVDVTNRGNGNDTVDLSLSGIPANQGWVYNFNPSSVALTPDETETVDLTFTIGSSAAYGDNLVTVKGTSHSTTVSGATSVVVSVTQFHNLALVPKGAATQRVDPGGTVTFNFTVTNTGNGPDDFTFTTVSLPSSWVTYFDKTTVYNLPANASDTSMLTIEIPSTANAGTYRFDVRANSDGNTSVFRTIKNVTVVVNQLFMVDLTADSLYVSGAPATGIAVNLTVTNDGSGRDNFTMSAPGQYTSWVSFNLTTVSLDPGASARVMATITPPDGTAAGDVTVAIRATSKGRTSVYDEASVTVSVTEVYRAKLTAVESTLTKKPTETATFTVRLENDGNTADTFKVNFTANPRNLASHSLASPFVTLAMDASRTFTVTMTVPSGEPVGNLVFRLLATSQNDTSSSQAISLTVVVDAVYAVDLVSFDPTASAEPTDSDTVELRVQNKGNGQDTFALKAIGPYYRWVSFESAQVTVGASGEVLVNITVTLPDTDMVSTGTYYINITATSTSEPTATKTLEVKVTVLHKEDLEVSASDLIRRRWVDPGHSVVYNLQVENLGMKDHVVNLALSGQHTDWAKLSKSLVIVSAGSTKPFSVTVTVPEGTAPMAFDLNVTGTLDDNEKRTHTMVLVTTVNTVRMVRAELNDTTTNAVPGVPTHLTLTVNNTGNAQDTFEMGVDVNPDWFSFSKKRVTLAAGANATLTVTIRPDADPLTPEGLYHINVTATSQGNTSVVGMSELELTVDQVYHVRVRARPSLKAIDPGDYVRYNVTITNEGNGRDTFVVTLEGTRKAWGSLDDEEVTLDAGAETVVVLTVRIPANQAVEDVVIAVRAISSGGEGVNATDSTTTKINPYFGVKLTVPDPSKAALPGKHTVFKVKVKNTGNDRDTFNFEVTGDWADWVLPIDPVTLDAGKTKEVDFNLTPPLETNNGLYEFTLNASSETLSDIFFELDLEVDINVYYIQQISLSDTEVDSRPMATEEVRIRILNLANINDTYDVEAVGLHSSWATIDNTTLEAGKRKVVFATVSVLVNTTRSGEYVLTFEVTSRGGGNVTELKFTINIQLYYGVGLVAVEEDTPAAPNSTVRLEVELTNEGNIVDTFKLTAQKPHSDWAASLEVEEVMVNASDKAYFNVTVDIPEGVKAGTYKVLIRAKSQDGPSKPDSTIYLNITISFEVNITAPSTEIRLLPDEAKVVQFTVKNEGLGRDTFDIEVAQPYRSWATPDMTMVTLEAGASALIDVTVRPPADALKGSYVVVLRAISVSDETVTDTDEIDVRVRQVYDISVSPMSSYLEGVANVEHDVTFTVYNHGNGRDDIIMSALVASGDPITVRFPTGLVSLDPGENSTVTMKIKGARDANAGSYVITVQARSTTSGFAPLEASVTFVIPAFYSVSILDVDQQSEVRFTDAVVGRSYQVSIEVTNLGNTDETFELVVTSDDPDLPTWFSFEGTTVSVEAGKKASQLVTIGVPSSALAGKYTFRIVAKSTSSNESNHLSGSISVKEDRGVTINADVLQRSIDPTGALGTSYVITINNVGNVNETVSLETTLPTGWGAVTYDPTPIVVPAYGQGTITMTVPVAALPDDPASTNAVTVKAKYGSYSSTSLSLVLNVLQPQVVIDSITPDSLSPQTDDEVVVTIRLKNTGQVDAEDAEVVLLANNQLAGKQTGVDIPAGGSVDVKLGWLVVDEADTAVSLKVRVPTFDVEKDAGDPITIASGERSFFEKITDMPFAYTIVSGLIIGLIVGLVIAGIVARRGRRKLERARAEGMAEGLSMAEDEGLAPPGEGEEGESEGEAGPGEDEEGFGGEEEEAEDEGEAEAEEEEPSGEVTPVTVKCPKCGTHNKVTTAQRPYEFRCEDCNALLRLKD